MNYQQIKIGDLLDGTDSLHDLRKSVISFSRKANACREQCKKSAKRK